MPYLGDYLGHLLSEITMARVQADLEAVRVAEMYAGHPLLKNLPVPHFRLPTVTLDVPVAIKTMEESKAGESPRGGVPLEALRQRFGPLLARHLQAAKIDLTPPEKVALDRALDQAAARLSQPPYIAISVMHIADELTAAAIAALDRERPRGQEIKPDQLERLAAEVKTAARAEFVNLRTPPPRLHVLVTSAELRQAGPPDVLARLRLSITEEGVEWTVIESQGRSYQKLRPE
jgi:hypothetical protein